MRGGYVTSIIIVIAICSTFAWWIYATTFTRQPDLNTLAGLQCIKNHGIPIPDVENQIIDCKSYGFPTIRPTSTPNTTQGLTTPTLTLTPPIRIHTSSTSANTSL